MDNTIGPSPLVELAVGIVMLIGVILTHGIGLRLINRRFNRAWVGLGPDSPRWRMDLLLACVVGAIAALHLLETLLFALPLARSGIVPNLRDSYFFVLESYTTLGADTLQLPDQWRLLGPIVAMAGLLTFGWTASVLVDIMTRFGRLDSDQAEAERKGASPTAQPGPDP